MNYWKTYFAIIVALIQMKALAAECDPHTAPPSRGVGKLVSGILVTSLTVPVGLVTGYVVGDAVAVCNGAGNEDEPRCKHTDRGIAYGVGTFAVIAAGGVTGGISLIRSSLKQRKTYKAWKQTCGNTTQTHATNSYYLNTMQVVPFPNGGIALAATFNLP